MTNCCNANLQDVKSSNTELTSEALVTPLARRTPSAPSSIAFLTSAPFFTPAPQSTRTLGLVDLTAATVLDTIEGSADVTEISPPISSGGSTAMKVGPSLAKAIAGHEYYQITNGDVF